MRGRRSVGKRVLIGTGSSVLGVLALLGVEVVAAVVRADDLDGYPSPALDGTVGSGEGEPLRIVWIGDSTGEGTGASRPGATLPHVFAAGLARPVDLTVLAVSGARVADAIGEQLPTLKELDPDWVVVGIGSNDVTHLTSRGRFRSEIEVLFDGVEAAAPDRIVALGIGEFAATPLFWQPLRTIVGRRGHRLDGDLRRIAIARGVTYVDIRGFTGPSFVADPKRYHARDGFHPSDEGYALWAEAMLAALR